MGLPIARESGARPRVLRGRPAWLVPAVALATMLGFWAVARATGFWETSVTPELFRRAYRVMLVD